MRRRGIHEAASMSPDSITRLGSLSQACFIASRSPFASPINPLLHLPLLGLHGSASQDPLLSSSWRLLTIVKHMLAAPEHLEFSSQQYHLLHEFVANRNGGRFPSPRRRAPAFDMLAVLGLLCPIQLHLHSMGLCAEIFRREAREREAFAAGTRA